MEQYLRKDSSCASLRGIKKVIDRNGSNGESSKMFVPEA